MELTKEEEAFILAERKRRIAQEERERKERESTNILRREGRITVTRYTGGHHATYGVYDGDELICVCVYKKGAFNLSDYILKTMNNGVIENGRH